MKRSMAPTPVQKEPVSKKGKEASTPAASQGSQDMFASQEAEEIRRSQEEGRAPVSQVETYQDVLMRLNRSKQSEQTVSSRTRRASTVCGISFR